MKIILWLSINSIRIEALKAFLMEILKIFPITRQCWNFYNNVKAPFHHPQGFHNDFPTCFWSYQKRSSYTPFHYQMRCCRCTIEIKVNETLIIYPPTNLSMYYWLYCLHTQSVIFNTSDNALALGWIVLT